MAHIEDVAACVREVSIERLNLVKKINNSKIPPLYIARCLYMLSVPEPLFNIIMDYGFTGPIVDMMWQLKLIDRFGKCARNLIYATSHEDYLEHLHRFDEITFYIPDVQKIPSLWNLHKSMRNLCISPYQSIMGLFSHICDHMTCYAHLIDRESDMVTKVWGFRISQIGMITPKACRLYHELCDDFSEFVDMRIGLMFSHDSDTGLKALIAHFNGIIRKAAELIAVL